jgi:antitoxin component YwqK of YwqJK toxin-antitoxin module
LNYPGDAFNSLSIFIVKIFISDMRGLVIIFIFITGVAYAQSPVSGDTVFNQSDKQGFKQGYWKGFYPNKKIKYIGFFKDNKPVGTFKRYYDDGVIKAIMVYNATGTRAFTTLFYQNGTRAAEGNYFGTQRDSTWNYFSYYDNTLKGSEKFVNGKKEGLSVSYYSTGKVSQELNYKNDLKHGIWRQYYDNGVLKISGAYTAGKRTGAFIVNYPSNKPEWRGNYANDIKNGKWIHYNPDGTVESEIEFINGIATNSEELNDRESKILEKLEKMKGSIPEPEENSFMQGSGM